MISRSTFANFSIALTLALAGCGGDSPAPVAPLTPAPPSSVTPAGSANAYARGDAGSFSNANDGLSDLVATFVDAPAEQHASILQQIKEEYGAPGLVAALSTNGSSSVDAYAREKFRTHEVMQALAALADPRGADALARYIEHANNPHWKFEAAVRLAEIGDLRAAPVLGARLAQDPLTLYQQDVDPEYRRDDTERIVAARMLADLATMYPSSHADLRAAAETQAIEWLTNKPQPHANGLRFLAIAESTTILPKLRAWADPQDALPARDAMMFPTSFATAQVALRYLGKTKDPSAFALLQKALTRRPANVSVAQSELAKGGNSIQGMALRALSMGAADGFAELGDARAIVLLEKLIEDPKENEQARQEACRALAWVATDKSLEDIANRAVAHARAASSASPAPEVSLCYLDTLSLKTTPAASTIAYKAFFQASASRELQMHTAILLGVTGVPDALRPKLVALLADPQLGDAAALALLLGGTTDDAMKATAGISTNTNGKDNLKLSYREALAYTSVDAYTRGDIGRWAANAAACRVQWPRAMLAQSLGALSFDQGPHSLTRPVFRHLLLTDARGAKDPERTQAGLLLLLAKEEGAIAALHEDSKNTP